MKHEKLAHPDEAPLISLSGAGIRRSGRWLVRGITFSIAPGEIVTLIGPNGAGKSTSAKLALGILKPDEGEARKRRNLTVGYVPQKLAIDWTLPLDVARFMRLTGRVDSKRIEAAMAETGVSHLASAEVRSLSGGEFQRVLLARAIARKPDLLVLDEPVQGVDFGGEVALYEMIRRVRDDMGCGVLLISHDLHVVMAATDRVVCLNGHVCCEGSPRAVAATPEYRRLFGDRAAEALAVYEHDHDHVHLPDGRIALANGSASAHGHADSLGHDHHPHHIHHHLEETSRQGAGASTGTDETGRHS
ncbi:MAG: metal ABC transporter ATP-binding protein [Fulvimarina manganoxydans]|uniref:ATP-binding cassette domain-containing protein n=1 Tax=Fulvimarina manganoxydans TaxID=937218 RepID=UPI0023548BB4|nr:metal ABC transporter ATP-binding protein [Fulvimarina manganoxydans]MCK5933624.1 metal ABC transporter ATP-binding protein [Fulvimarina manganoxydans]